jgi:hypothetical protein
LPDVGSYTVWGRSSENGHDTRCDAVQGKGERQPLAAYDVPQADRFAE